MYDFSGNCYCVHLCDFNTPVNVVDYIVLVRRLMEVSVMLRKLPDEAITSEYLLPQVSDTAQYWIAVILFL